MIKRMPILAVALLALAMAFATSTAYGRAPAGSLVDTLATLRDLGSGSFQQVVWWSSNPRDTSLTVPDWNRAEHEIMQLRTADRDAVIAWLQGRGRQALYDRGATDAMIGPRRSQADNRAPSTPKPAREYRTMPLESTHLRGAAAPHSGIDVIGGFAMIKKDATKAIVCLSFKNVAPQAAKSVHFEFPLYDASGDHVGTLQFTRRGTFSPNVAIEGPKSADGYFDPGFSSRSMFENCLVSDQQTAALPLRRTHSVGYRVVRVEYADGSVWP